jgi:NAD(P)-dependent dehydrogenase (short-subunit alcohol dehydrogenase family)
MLLKDKVSIITGGSRGIGKAIAARFIKEGSAIVLVARTKSDLEATRQELANSTSRVEIFQADVSKEDNVRGVIDFTLEKFSTVDVLVNCAGVLGPIGLITDIDNEDWLQTVKTNLYGTFLCIKAVLPIMMKKNSGKILNLSGGGSVSPRPRFSAYGTSKAGVVRLTETIAGEIKDFSIGINAIAPGAVNTRLLDQVLEAGDAAGPEEKAKAIKQKKEGGVSPGKVADLAVFLASSESDGLSGRLISMLWDSWRDIPQHLNEIMSSDIYATRRVIPRDRGYDW